MATLDPNLQVVQRAEPSMIKLHGFGRRTTQGQAAQLLGEHQSCSVRRRGGLQEGGDCPFDLKP
jgi:hypothetical protein